jgi:hypothetical protein
MVQVLGEGRVGDGARDAGFYRHHGVGRLQEEKRGLASGKAHFLGVLFIVAAHAVHAAHRESLGTAGNRH